MLGNYPFITSAEQHLFPYTLADLPYVTINAQLV